MAALLRHRRALPGDERLAAAAREHIAGNDRLTPVEQLEIYREQFWLRHTAALLEDFPGLSGILGQASWERLAEGYLEEVVPTSWTLRDLGARLPAHVERCDWLPHRDLCVDMARLEWAHVEVFDAEDVPRLTPARLEGLPDEAWLTARIVLGPALALVRVRHPVAELRRAIRAADGGAVPLPAPAPANLVVHRGDDLSLHDETVGDAAFELLVALGEGVPLAPACERTSRRVPGAAEELEREALRWFNEWAQRGWIVDVETA